MSSASIDHTNTSRVDAEPSTVGNVIGSGVQFVYDRTIALGLPEQVLSGDDVKEFVATRIDDLRLSESTIHSRAGKRYEVVEKSVRGFVAHTAGTVADTISRPFVSEKDADHYGHVVQETLMDTEKMKSHMSTIKTSVKETGKAIYNDLKKTAKEIPIHVQHNTHALVNKAKKIKDILFTKDDTNDTNNKDDSKFMTPKEVREMNEMFNQPMTDLEKEIIRERSSHAYNHNYNYDDVGIDNEDKSKHKQQLWQNLIYDRNRSMPDLDKFPFSEHDSVSFTPQYKIAGMREELNKREWTIETIVKEMGILNKDLHPMPPSTLNNSNNKIELDRQDIYDAITFGRLAVHCLDAKDRVVANHVITAIGNVAMLTFCALNPFQIGICALSLFNSLVDLVSGDDGGNNLQQQEMFELLHEILSVLKKHTLKLDEILHHLSVSEQRQLTMLLSMAELHQGVFCLSSYNQLQYALLTSGTPTVDLNNVKSCVERIENDQAQQAYDTFLDRVTSNTYGLICSTRIHSDDEELCVKWYDEIMSSILVAMEMPSNLSPAALVGKIHPDFFSVTKPPCIIWEFLASSALYATTLFYPANNSDVFESKGIHRGDIERLEHICDVGRQLLKQQEEQVDPTLLIQKHKLIMEMYKTQKQLKWNEVDKVHCLHGEQFLLMKQQKNREEYLAQTLPKPYCFYSTPTSTWFSCESNYEYRYHCFVKRSSLYCCKDTDMPLVPDAPVQRHILNEACGSEIEHFGLRTGYETQQRQQMEKQLADTKCACYMKPVNGHSTWPILPVWEWLHEPIMKDVIIKYVVDRHLAELNWTYDFINDTFYIYVSVGNQIDFTAVWIIPVEKDYLGFYKVEERMWKMWMGGNFPTTAVVHPQQLPYRGGADLSCGYLNTYAHMPTLSNHEPISTKDNMIKNNIKPVFQQNKMDQLTEMMNDHLDEYKTISKKHAISSVEQLVNEEKQLMANMIAQYSLQGRNVEDLNRMVRLVLPDYELVWLEPELPEELEPKVQTLRTEHIVKKPRLFESILKTLELIILVLKPYVSAEKERQGGKRSRAQSTYMQTLLTILHELHGAEHVASVIDQANERFGETHAALLPTLRQSMPSITCIHTS